MLTEKTMSKANNFAKIYGAQVEVHFEGGDEQRIRRWLGHGTALYVQSTGDLGEKMYRAFRDAFDRGTRRTVLIGTDIPRLNMYHLESAFNALENKDLVLGPSTDGGFWLMGLRRPVDLFHDIDWGTENVLEKTILHAKERGMSIQQLEPLTDIDTEEDLREWRPDLDIGRPYVSVIIPALNEEGMIAGAIESALDAESEVIVVDGGSRDNTVAAATNVGARVEKSAPGRSLQQNVGAKLARSDVLLFLHSDTRLPERYIDYVFDLSGDRNMAAGAFMFKTDLGSSLMRVIEFVTNLRARYLQLPYGDQCIFLRKNVFDSMGGFPDVPIAEDLILMRNLSKKGSIRIASVPVVTSGRRWKKHGVVLTTLINQIIMLGCYLGISPSALQVLYGRRENIEPLTSPERNMK
jgi:rSAM/selenodomain-associated transferase 2/rSAM/selenodomain-associated transferase 1